MKVTRQSLTLLPWLLCLAFGSGCATKALWDNSSMEAWNEPANDANVHLYDGGKRNDMLVVYQEYSERTGKQHTRAYWLNENQRRLDECHMPDFVSTNYALHLLPVPVFNARPERVDFSAGSYALLGANQQSFTLYSEGGQIVSHDLPVYNDGKGKLEKAALTPVTVTADLTIIGGVLGYFYLAELCGADTSNSSY